LPDEELARQSQDGSLTAFEELVRRYEGRIFAFATHGCGPGADAAGITQDTFVRAFRAIGQFDPRRGFGSWLFGIARNRCADHHRAAVPEISVEQPPDLPDADDPAELLARREEIQDIWRLARRCLPAVQFQAIWLRYAEDMSLAEIARALNKTQTHVKVLLFRARQALIRGQQSAERVAGQAGWVPTLAPGEASGTVAGVSAKLKNRGPQPA